MTMETDADTDTSTSERPVVSSDTTQTHIKGEGVHISIGQARNVIVGNGSQIVLSSKSKSASKGKEKLSDKKRDIACKHPVTTSQECLTMDHKLAIKDRVGRQWKTLGRKLGLSDPELEQLAMDHSSDCAEVVYQILSRWEQYRTAHQATRATLAAVFLTMGRGDLVDILSDSDSEVSGGT